MQETNTDGPTGPGDHPAIKKIATGFEFAEGICKDSKGNIYFCESRMRRIYQWSAATGKIHLLADYAWDPLSLACDKNDNLLVVFKYTPKPGWMVNGRQEVFTNPPDAAGTSFSGWGNSGFATRVYSIDPQRPDETIRLLEKIPMGKIPVIHKALYPGHRWRDGHDFNTVTVNKAGECFVAPDGVTIIPVVYDLARAASLATAYPGKPLYVTDEYEKRTVQLDVSPEGWVTHLRPFAEKGEFGTTTDGQGRVYIADGQVYVFDAAGKPVKELKIPERPGTIVSAGKDGKELFITGGTSLYSVKIE